MRFSTFTLALSVAQTAVTAPIAASLPLSKRFDANALLKEVLDAFPLNILVNDIQETVVNGLQDVAGGLDIDTTQDAGAACADVTVLFARGTDEPGNVGVLAGPAFFQAIEDTAGGKVAVQGTDNCE